MHGSANLHNLTMNQADLYFLLTFDTDEVWTRVDIDKSTAFSLTLSGTDATAPTATKNTYSSQVTLPKSPINDDIFSNISVLDARLLRFSPIKRTEFRLYIGGRIFTTGYFVLESVTESGYAVRLYGGLGDYFYTLANLSLSDLFTSEFDHTINANSVLTSWCQTSQGNTSPWAFFGYAMTYQGAYDNFDSDTITLDTANSDGDYTEAATWQSADGLKTYANPELTEHRRNVAVNGTDVCGTFVSYYQRPMVYVQKVISQIVDKMEAAGWTTNLGDFFNDTNPYWSRLWMIMRQCNVDSQSAATEYDFDTIMASTASGVSGINHYGYGDEVTMGSGTTWADDDCRTICNVGGIYEKSINSQNAVGGTDFSVGSSVTHSYSVSFSHSIAANTTETMEVYVPFSVRWLNNGNLTEHCMRKSGSQYETSTINPMYITIYLTIGGTRVKTLGKKTFNNNTTNAHYMDSSKREEYSWFNQDRDDENADSASSSVMTEYYVKLSPSDFARTTKTTTIGLDFVVSGDTRWFTFKKKNGKGDVLNEWTPVPLIRINKGGYIKTANSADSATRSGATRGWSDVMQSEKTCFDFLMSYCKAFGLYFVKDDVKKSVSILTRNEYYSGDGVDLTDRVDKSKGMTICPTKVDYAKGIFQWTDAATKYEDNYTANNDRQYGSMTLNTGYDIDDSEEEYLSDSLFANCVIATDYNQYYAGRNNTQYRDNKSIPHFEDSDGGGVDVDFALVFRTFTPNEADAAFAIQDDTTNMKIYGQSWQNGSGQITKKYPNLTRRMEYSDEEYSLYFGEPDEVYSEVETDTPTAGGSIYERFWKSFLGDQLNRHTKTLECYVYLRPDEVNAAMFRKFYYINNTCWVLSKVSGYNPLSSAATKCTFVQVQSREAYTAGQAVLPPYMKVTALIGSTLTTLYDSTSGGGDVTTSIQKEAQRVTLVVSTSGGLSAAAGGSAYFYMADSGATLTDGTHTISEGDTITWTNTTQYLYLDLPQGDDDVVLHFTSAAGKTFFWGIKRGISLSVETQGGVTYTNDWSTIEDNSAIDSTELLSAYTATSTNSGMWIKFTSNAAIAMYMQSTDGGLTYTIATSASADPLTSCSSGAVSDLVTLSSGTYYNIKAIGSGGNGSVVLYMTIGGVSFNIRLHFNTSATE